MKTERLEQTIKVKERGSLLLKEFSALNHQRLAEKTSPSFAWRKRGASRKKFNREEEFRLALYRIFTQEFSKKRSLMLKEFIDNLEKSIIINVLEKVYGHQKEAAKVLGMKYTTLNEKVKKYRIRFYKSPFIQND